ncbi:hypothetical protein F5Y18DRAFT_377781 [Xylariaceae sp. FL1019]|nr:hypothetical protein F5Y18DRAFT_377781 [Xylariaceae sp. FL1019]
MNACDPALFWPRPLCDCANCTLFSTFTTAYAAFYTEGFYAFQVQTYAVTEAYVGASTLPSFPESTVLPQGFTSHLETCVTGCGAGEVAATMIYPAGGSPYIASPTTAPNQTASVTGDKNGGGMGTESEYANQSSSPEEGSGQGGNTTDAGGLEAPIPITSEESGQTVITGDAPLLTAPIVPLVLAMGMALALQIDP